MRCEPLPRLAKKTKFLSCFRNMRNTSSGFLGFATRPAFPFSRQRFLDVFPCCLLAGGRRRHFYERPHCIVEFFLLRRIGGVRFTTLGANCLREPECASHVRLFHFEILLL